MESSSDESTQIVEDEQGADDEISVNDEQSLQDEDDEEYEDSVEDAEDEEEDETNTRETPLPIAIKEHTGLRDHHNSDFNSDSDSSASSITPITTTESHEDIEELIAHILSFVSSSEAKALRDGKQASGPPIQYPVEYHDQFKRKFRWPMHIHNVRNQNFYQDPLEIFSDYELVSDADATMDLLEKHSTTVARPLIECIARNASDLVRKRKRQNENESPPVMDPAKLYELSKYLSEFSDRLLATMLKQNAIALQGRASIYSQKCWSRLPTSKRPVANWRFVFEQLCNPTSRSQSSLGNETLLDQIVLCRIRDRLKTLYGIPWMKQDQVDFFRLPEQRQEELETASKNDD
uniref:Uncharacterized protein AlNc14C13G1533 n=1 Tax=Albugo laibachii Nc14 TaxID=890382 RepID=F0W3G5_9STRA|nr:conserved hypothetical protein [Albugo laibachii Nc14]CCA16330.1 conserved hypothetical protein [Albugo laibachii Nc14]|eukprot:CCA16330.1 conserved hypothetical protein [Albugo laibachii Nc14]